MEKEKNMRMDLEYLKENIQMEKEMEKAKNLKNAFYALKVNI